MKTRNILALIVLSCVLVFTGCKKKDEGGIPAHLKIVPSNSLVVMSINAKELVEKGGLNSYKDFEIYKKFSQEIARNEPEASKLMDEFLKDTRASGLNLDKIFMYSQRVGEYDELSAFTFSVDNSDKVAKWIAKLHQIVKEDQYELIEGNGYKAYRLTSRFILVWDETKAILLTVREDEEKDYPGFESFLSVDEKLSIVANENFMESYNAQKDYTVWVSLKEAMAQSGDNEAIEQLTSFAGQDWSKASFDISLSFTNEKVALSASVWPASLMDELKKKYPLLKDSFDESLLSYFPQQFFAAIKTSINVKEYYRLVVDQLNSVTDSLQKAQENGGYDSYYGYHALSDIEYLSQLRSAITSENVAKIVSSFKGDLVADIFGFQEGFMPIPYFGIAVTIEGEQAFNHLLSILPKDIALTKTDSYYSYSIPQVMTVYAGQKNDVMYISNSKEAIDNFYAQGYKDNLSTSGIATFLKESPILYSINTDISSYPALITTMLKESMGTMGYAVLSDFVEPFSSLNIIQTGNNSAELNLILKENKENSLKVILKVIDSFSVKWLGLGN